MQDRPTRPILPFLLFAALLTLAPGGWATPAAPAVAVAGQADEAPLEADAIPQAADAAAPEKEGDWQANVDSTMQEVNYWIAQVIFFDVWPFDNKPKLNPEDNSVIHDARGRVVVDKGIEVRFAVLWLILGAVFFTVRMGFINVRAFGHAIGVVRGRYSDPNAKAAGEVSHFQALSAALSATVGLGNIASVAIAISLGGPGATFWMVLAGLLGMTSKFTECMLGQRYREVRPDGQVMGGAMYYLSNGLRERGLGWLGMILAPMFALLCVGGSLAGGNSFQVNQSLSALGALPELNFLRPVAAGGDGMGWIYGAVMTVMVGIVIIGGIRRIAQVAEKVVPTMCSIYIVTCIAVLFINIDGLPLAISKIFTEAFSPKAVEGGAIGVLILGFQRAAFSNEAGVGSAAIAHSAAKTEYPVREGIVALLEPFIDTVVVCTMTALVIVVTGVYADDTIKAQGAALTSAAFTSEVPWFAYILAVATMLFAFSTMISWSYYGERCWSWMFGERWSLVYKLVFLSFTFIGSVITAQAVLDFGDLMILGMALPNILGLFLLSGLVRRELNEYWEKKRRNEFPTYK